jgi:hypothetical protein
MTCPTDQIVDTRWRWYRFPFYVPKPGVERDEYGRAPWGNRMSNPDVLVFKAEKPVKLNYYAERKMWLPVDEDALEPFKWQEIDKKATRKLNEQYRLTDFNGFLKTLTTLVDNAMPPWGGDIPDEQLLEIIKSGDFQKAMAHFPRGGWRGWHNQYYLRHNPNYLDDKPPTYSYFSNLRTQLYKKAGVLIDRSEKILTLPQFTKVKGLLYRFE